MVVATSGADKLTDALQSSCGEVEGQLFSLPLD
jgi:hypothetical protein